MVALLDWNLLVGGSVSLVIHVVVSNAHATDPVSLSPLPTLFLCHLQSGCSSQLLIQPHAYWYAPAKAPFTPKILIINSLLPAD